MVDNLSTGHREAVGRGLEFHEGDLLDTRFVEKVLSRGVDAVCHFAAFSRVGESVADPLKYYRNNVSGAVSLLTAMKETGVRRFLFSSTAAVYGEPEEVPITEQCPTAPVNAYGNTKLAIERMLADCAGAWGLVSLSLRYFNAAGASAEHGEDHRPETHLIPLVLAAAMEGGEQLVVFGDDYPTPDGTCVRDYIHVLDLASAHLLGLEKLGEGYSGVLNLGNGTGFSVREVIDSAMKVTGREIPFRIGPRRPGDPAVLVASSAKAEEVLGWKRERTGIDRIISDAWEWKRSFPMGYRASP